MRRAVIALLLGVAGCQPVAVPVRPDPIDVHVPPECTQACTCDAQTPTITTDPYSAVDAATFEHQAGRVCVKQCDKRRQGCVDAIERARKAGAIR